MLTSNSYELGKSVTHRKTDSEGNHLSDFSISVNIINMIYSIRIIDPNNNTAYLLIIKLDIILHV